MRAAAAGLALAAALGIAHAAAAIPTAGPGRLVFVSVDRAGRGTALVSTAPDGRGRKVLARGLPWVPAIAPDGTRVAFSAASSPGFVAAFFRAEIAVASGGKVRRLTTDHVGDWAPRWSPDGRSIAFDRRNRFGAAQVVVVPAAGGSPRVIAEGAGASWSPDGMRLVLGAVPPGAPAAEVFVVGADGAGAVRVTTATDGRSASLPSFSPDGAHIAFLRGSTLEVVPAEGGEARPLGAALADAPPAWSPDGRRIAAGCGRGDLCVFPAAGGTPVRVAAPGPFSGVAWSPDGARLAFGSAATVYVVGADGRGKRAVARGRSPDWR